MPTQNRPTQNVEPTMEKPEGTQTAVLVHKGYGTFGVSEALLNQTILAIRDGEAKAKSTGKIQTFEVSRKGHRQNLVIGRIYVVPPSVADDVKDFPTSLLFGAICSKLNPNDYADVASEQIGGSEFDEYSKPDMDVIKDKLFKNAEGKYDVLVFFNPAWAPNREQIFFPFTKDEEALAGLTRHLIFSAYYNPALSSAWDLLMEKSDDLVVSEINPKLTFPWLTEGGESEEGVNKSYPELKKVASKSLPKMAFTRANLAGVREDVLEPKELAVLDEMSNELKGQISGEITPIAEAGSQKVGGRGMHDCPECGKNVSSGSHNSLCEKCQKDKDSKKASITKKADRHEETEIDGHSYTVDTWEERDRLHISLKDECCDKELLDLWDDDAREAITDGFIDPRNLVESTMEYARSLGLLGKDDPKEAAGNDASPVTSGISDMNGGKVPVEAASMDVDRPEGAFADKLRPFSKHDWDGLAGAEGWDENDPPLIAEIQVSNWPEKDEFNTGKEHQQMQEVTLIVDARGIALQGLNGAFHSDVVGKDQAVHEANELLQNQPINVDDLIGIGGWDPINFPSNAVPQTMGDLGQHEEAQDYLEMATASTKKATTQVEAGKFLTLYDDDPQWYVGLNGHFSYDGQYPNGSAINFNQDGIEFTINERVVQNIQYGSSASRHVTKYFPSWLQQNGLNLTPEQNQEATKELQLVLIRLTRERVFTASAKKASDIIPSSADEALNAKTEEIGAPPLVDGVEPPSASGVDSTKSTTEPFGGKSAPTFEKSKEEAPKAETKTEEPKKEEAKTEEPKAEENDENPFGKEAGFSYLIPGQVLKNFYPDLQHEIVDAPQAENSPMIEDIDLIASLDHALDSKQGFLTEDGPAVSTSPAAGAGIGRDGKEQVLEGAPLRKENDIRGYGFSNEFYKQYEGVPGAFLTVAAGLKKNKKADKQSDLAEFKEFLKRVVGEIAATLIYAYKATSKMPMNMVPGKGEVQLQLLESGPSQNPAMSVNSRVQHLIESTLNDGDMKEAINQASAQAAVWNGDEETGFCYEVFVRAEELDTDTCMLHYSFITGTKGA